MGNYFSNIGLKLDSFFKEKGISSYKIARDTGISEPMIGRYRIGQSIPSTDKLEIIVDAFPELQTYLIGAREDVPEKKQESSDSLIPLVETEALGGFGNPEFAITNTDIVDHYSIPDFHKASFMIRVRGNSMEPKYSSGDLVACVILRESKFIQWNEIHVIATREQGILIKRIRQGDNGNIIAVSENKEFPPFEIPRAEITGIALVLGGVRLE